MDKNQIIKELSSLKKQGDLQSLLPQNLPQFLLNVLCDLSDQIGGNLYCDNADVFHIYVTWFLYGRKLDIIPNSIMIKKFQIISIALKAEKARREGVILMKDWPLPTIDDLFEEKGVDFYFYNKNPNTISSNNPLGILDDPFLNKNHRLPNMIDSFSKDLMTYFKALEDHNGGLSVNDLINVAVYFAIDIMIEYRDNAQNLVPVSIIKDVKSQVISALKNIFDIPNEQHCIDEIQSHIDRKIWETNIESETHEFLARIRNF